MKQLPVGGAGSITFVATKITRRLVVTLFGRGIDRLVDPRRRRLHPRPLQDGLRALPRFVIDLPPQRLEVLALETARDRLARP